MFSKTEFVIVSGQIWIIPRKYKKLCICGGIGNLADFHVVEFVNYVSNRIYQVSISQSFLSLFRAASAGDR